jgi:spore germination cell wall hydrolase CwlJ-like protein
MTLLLGGLIFLGATSGSAASTKIVEVDNTTAALYGIMAEERNTLKTESIDRVIDYSNQPEAAAVAQESLKSPEQSEFALANISTDSFESIYSLDGDDVNLYANQHESKIVEQHDKTNAELDEEVNNYVHINTYSEQEKIYIARVVYAESRGEVFDGQVAVARVVLNRFESGKFGSSVKRVVFARHQFAVSKKYNDKAMAAVEEAILSSSDFPSDMYYFQASKRKHWRNFEYYKRIGGHSFYCAAS